ncbi:hypothetical protein HBI56_177850 [Parastagonospora nodorum]|uniref:J domain-containing protein n=1 Tax=Phaeosphaeria nodorum (strain SN15 / ATCC MYA-4574 / FGSC 10173) TaxID=321614 RepID=A0A7U2ESZ7_PHANO|nr:hypothetical protein HBH56_047460 [Parastagonospora nodorum]QRC92530.1 hypothetical protein JI435_084050 [Parastagonospora nodorum SN15]KAH3933165.1 hypothetical protein HBH54_075200 [Parastagonospora nodorum]KAH4004245.1 hypothetical protein HBI10_054190 [Parastagonospora nodorum]KAH4017063.1 hypothetical protein HBI13_147020 [Parastagonospora nodorum]
MELSTGTRFSAKSGPPTTPPIEPTRPNYYSDLGLTQFASPPAIKKAYHVLALRYHPDKQLSNDTSAFRKVNEAYEVLRNPLQRRKYDLTYNFVRRELETYREAWREYEKETEQQPEQAMELYAGPHQAVSRWVVIGAGYRTTRKGAAQPSTQDLTPYASAVNLTILRSSHSDVIKATKLRSLCIRTEGSKNG